MWFNRAANQVDWCDAAEHLAAADPVLGRVIRRVGPCTLAPRKDYFVALCKAIFAQQLSTKIAATLFGRFCGLFPRGRPTPTSVLEALNGDGATLRWCGVSRQKAVYLRELAGHFSDRRIPTRKLARMTDEQVIESLTAVKGIGRWTAEMFLIFVLNRPDVLPVDDLGLREGVRDIYQLDRRPTAAEVTALGERWRPYRTVATWYIWRRATTPMVAARSASSARHGSVATSRRRRSAASRS